MQIGNGNSELPVQMCITMPKEWVYKESFTLIAPDGQANVILSSEPVSLSLTRDEYSESQGELLAAEFPGYRQIAYEDFALGSAGIAKLRIFEWTPEGSDTVTQAQLYYVVAGRGITSTGTTPSALFPDVKSTLIDSLRSITVTTPVDRK